MSLECGLVFWVSGLVLLDFWTCIPDLYFGYLDMYFGCLGLYVGRARENMEYKKMYEIYEDIWKYNIHIYIYIRMI